MSRATLIVPDERGFPVMLADVPDVGVSSVDSDARGGNPRHDVRSGRFARGPRRRRQAQANEDPEELRLRSDAVRDAAREFDAMDAGDAREFLQGRVRDMSKVDFDAFLRDVREARLDDLADILDHQIRGKVERLARSRRRVRVSAPRGYTRRVFNGLDDAEVLSLAVRMERRGFDDDDIRQHILGRIKAEDRRGRLEAEYGSRVERYRARR